MVRASGGTVANRALINLRSRFQKTTGVAVQSSYQGLADATPQVETTAQAWRHTDNDP